MDLCSTILDVLSPPGDGMRLHLTQVKEKVRTKLFPVISQLGLYIYIYIDIPFQRICGDGITCVVLLCPVLPAHCFIGVSVHAACLHA